MPNPSNKNNSIQYSLGKICGSIEAIQEDISDIKENMIPNGNKRMDTAEQKIETLTVWKKTSMTLVGVCLGMMGWIEAKIDFIGGMFNG